jgi:hypothetical protein
MVIYSKTRIRSRYYIKLSYLFYNDLEMSLSPSNHHKINKMCQDYKDELILENIAELLKNINHNNRKFTIQECNKMIKDVQNTKDKKYIRMKQSIDDFQYGHIVEEFYQKSLETVQVDKHTKNVDTFDNWIASHTELHLLLNCSSDDYSKGEQLYYGRKLMEEYTKYVSECSRQFVIPSPFPNIEIMNRMCESITLENGRIIKNPNYIPEYKAPLWFCCFT